MCWYGLFYILPSWWYPMKDNFSNICLFILFTHTGPLTFLCVSLSIPQRSISFRSESRTESVMPPRPWTRPAPPANTKRRDSKLWSETFDVRLGHQMLSSKEINRQEVRKAFQQGQYGRLLCKSTATNTRVTLSPESRLMDETIRVTKGVHSYYQRNRNTVRLVYAPVQFIAQFWLEGLSGFDFN